MPKKPKSEIGPILRTCRLNCGLSQKQVANAIGRDRTTIGSWENMRTEPNLDEIIKLAQIYRIDPTEILPGENTGIELKDSSDDKNTLKPIYSLTKQEQQLLVSFRLLSEEKREEFLAKITNITRTD